MVAGNKRAYDASAPAGNFIDSCGERIEPSSRPCGDCSVGLMICGTIDCSPEGDHRAMIASTATGPAPRLMI